MAIYKETKILLLSFLLFFNFLQYSAFAQFTEVINSNRPGFSESPYSVGRNVYQLEAGVFYKNISPTFTIPKSLGTRLVFRTSLFFEKLELNTNISFQRDKLAVKNSSPSIGVSEFTIGAKYLVYQPKKKDSVQKEIRSWKRKFAFTWKKLIPTIGVYAGVNTNLLSKAYTTQNITPKVGVFLQNELYSDLNVITNFYYDKLGSDSAEFSYIVTGTYSPHSRWSTFIEAQGIHTKHIVKNNYGIGIAYLFNRNLQLDTSVRYIMENKTKGMFFGLGASYRLDRHVDDFIKVDDNGNEIKEIILDYNQGFFTRIWGRIKRIFIKNNQEFYFKGKKSKRKKRVRKKSILRKIKKQDSKRKKKIARRKAREERRNKKAAEKAKRKKNN